MPPFSGTPSPKARYHCYYKSVCNNTFQFLRIIGRCKAKKVKLSLYAPRKHGGPVPLILNLGTRWRQGPDYMGGRISEFWKPVQLEMPCSDKSLLIIT